MFQQLFAVIRNTFFESIRQPIMLVVLIIATIALFFSNPLSAFTMSNDQRMLIDLGLATVFLCGTLLAAFIATNVLGREIENRTALTVISKPIARPIFVVGKYLGVAAAMMLGTLYMSFFFLLVEQHTVLQTVRDPIHVPVIIFGTAAAVIGLVVAVWCNYFYGKVFSSTVISVTTPLMGLAYLFSMMYRPDFSLQPISRGFRPEIWMALIALMIAILVLTAIAVAASTRLGQVLTLCVTLGVFMAGMLSDWMFGRPLARIEMEWNQRVIDTPEPDLRKVLENGNADDLRAWIFSVHVQRAQHESSLWHCAYLAETFKERAKLKGMPEAEQNAAKDRIRSEQAARAETKLATDEKDAHRIADAVPWPPLKKDLVLTMDWPQSVERPAGECETIATTKTFVYPPLLDALTTGGERAERAAYQVAFSIVPNFQVLLLSDAVTQEHVIPRSYIVRTALYSLCFIVAALSAATLLFQRREVG